MIDTNELRRLAQAATPGPWKACRNHECYEGAYFEIDPEDEAEYAAKPFTHIQARTGVVAAAHDLFEFHREDAEFIAAANPAAISELLDRIEAAEKERDILRDKLALESQENGALRDSVDRACEERDALRAKIEALEQQEPVAWRYQDVRGNHRYRSYVAGFDVEYRALKPIPLYALPGAQTQGEEK